MKPLTPHTPYGTIIELKPGILEMKIKGAYLLGKPVEPSARVGDSSDHSDWEIKVEGDGRWFSMSWFVISEEQPNPIKSAPDILRDAADTIGNRAAERDQESERSMAKAVNAFNATYGLGMTETQGWMFMIFLKASRASVGDFRMDDYTDGAAYFALAGECEAAVKSKNA